ncbi:MAG TPA: ThiF family adenylyltransferase, partial [Phycisphaerae bacterium]
MPDPNWELGNRQSDLSRYSRQVLVEGIGESGQRRLLDARVLLVGCGALGSVLAETLVRAGVGHLRICDRDFIELNNLQRQVLFDEDDIAANLPKAEAARRKLARMNSHVTVEALVTDVNHTNIERLAEGAQLLLDGTDNFETRFLINDLAIKTQRPWIYGAVIGTSGLMMPILPGQTPCLRCVFETAPPPEMNPTCDTAGVLGPVVNLIASLQSLEALKILAGATDAVNRNLVSIDAWSGRFINLKVDSARDKGDCPCCRQARFDYLEGREGRTTSVLCGRDAVQIRRPADGKLDLAAMALKLQASAAAPVQQNAYMLR